jgi:hypothetical protein
LCRYWRRTRIGKYDGQDFCRVVRLPLFLMRGVLTDRGASAIVLVDLNKADAEAAAKDLTDWFGKPAFSYWAIES